MPLVHSLLWALLFLVTAVRPAPLVSNTSKALPRLVLYYQTTHDAQGRPISLLPLITKQNIALTHLVVSALHINAGGVVHLNDFPPDDSRFDTLWNEVRLLQAAGVRVTAMVGGWASGSYASNTLDSTDDAVFAHYYAQLLDVVSNHSLQGLDLDVEQSMRLAGIERLVAALARDFPDRAAFDLSLAPVASALRGDGGSNLSGFDYAALAASPDAGPAIAFYNAQFYNGFGSLASPADYAAIIAAGWLPQQVLLGSITAPSEGSGYVPPGTLNATVVALRAQFGPNTIGGIMGWEYFDAAPGGSTEPWAWAQAMTAILRPNNVPRLAITAADAARLTNAWQRSVVRSSHLAAQKIAPTVDYASMVNA